MKPVMKLVVAILPVLLIVGCGGDEAIVEDPAAGQDVTVDGGGATTGDSVTGTKLGDSSSGSSNNNGAVSPSGADDAASDASADLLSERKIYFDFDRSEIKSEYREILKAHANYLALNSDAMALGERRAYSVKQFLSLQGVSNDQVRTVSFGEERPDVEGHDESAWKWNRRAVFVYAE